MKPLTVEELKVMKVGDWVWVQALDGKYGAYGRVCERFDEEHFRCETIESYLVDPYNTYGKTWLAYKNKEQKEQAEAKGEIVELSCKVGDKIFIPWIWDDSDGIMNLTVTSITLRNNGIDYFCNNLETDDINFAKQFDLGNFHSTDYNSIWFTDKSEAERRFAELKGERV